MIAAAITFLKGNWQRIAIYAALAAAVLTVTWFHGLFTGRSDLVEYQAEQATHSAHIIVKQGKATEKVVYKYVTVTVPKTQTVTKTVEKEVIKYVDSGRGSCGLDRGFVSLHDSAALNTVPDPATVIDGTASGLTTADALKTITGNYAICHETADRLRALQEWVREQAAVRP